MTNTEAVASTPLPPCAECGHLHYRGTCDLSSEGCQCSWRPRQQVLLSGDGEPYEVVKFVEYVD